MLISGEDLYDRAGVTLGFLLDDVGKLYGMARLLLGRGRPDVLRPRALDGPADGAQSFPAPLLGNRAAELGRHEGRCLLRRPHPAIVRRVRQPLPQLAQKFRGKHGGRRAVAAPSVAQARWPEGVVARKQLLHPALGKARQARNIAQAPPLS